MNAYLPVQHKHIYSGILKEYPYYLLCNHLCYFNSIINDKFIANGIHLDFYNAAKYIYIL